MQDKLLRAWIMLLVLSIASTLLAMGIDRTVTLNTPETLTALAGAGILGLALAKARVILLYYLRLNTTAFWRRGFTFTLSIFALALLALYLPSRI